MLEIFVLIAMCRYLHRTATGKGYSGWPFVLLMIFGWFAGGIGGGILGLVVMGDDGEFPVGFLLGYLIGVALACIGNSIIVAVLPAKEHANDRDYSTRRRRPRFEDEEDPKDRDDRRRYDRDDDHDDRRPRRYDDR